ncbi:ATP-binding protein [Streptomyces sp. NBC_00076]|uniref:ATP-binding protein n=1 Tax=Streptomyces sp. NBC_00076 TaxID=2975642 RepID=UPI0032482568
MDGGALATAVLAHIGGMPARAAFDALLERGEHDVAERLFEVCAELRERDGAILARKLESARVGSAEVVRQRITRLSRRAEAAGVPFEQPDTAALVGRSRSRVAAAEDVLVSLERELDAQVDALAHELEQRITEQEQGQKQEQEQEQAVDEGFAAARVRALLAAGELVTARALLNREPIGVLIPEAVTPLPVWDRDWAPETLLEYHLDPVVRRPPEFAAWQAADDDAKALLAAFDRLSREPSREAAEGFANTLGRFLGASGKGAEGSRVGGGYYTYFDGLFSSEPFSGLRPTGRVDLYVADPEVTTVAAELAAQGPIVAVGPGLVVTGYTDRQTVGVLCLRDLLRLAVLRTDRRAGLLGILAGQWPVEAFIGNSPAALGRVLGDDADVAWRTLRWITRLSLHGGASMVQVMENCTGMEPELLWVMLRYAQAATVPATQDGLWVAETGGWRGDEALVHALRAELLARCGEQAAQAAWWASLTVCDTEDGCLTREDLADSAELCSTWTAAKAQVLAGAETLVARGLLELVRRDAEAVPTAPETADVSAGEEDSTCLRVPLSGVVRALIPMAERELTGLLEEMERAEGSDLMEGDTASAGDDCPPTFPGWTTWHRNRFAPVPSYLRYIEAETQGADADELAAVAVLADRELHQNSPDDLVAGSVSENADLGAVLAALAAECQEQYPTVRLDLRCPERLGVAVPEPVLRAVLYEVMDNAAEVVAGRGDGLMQVSVVLESPEVLVEVRDNGPGLPADVRARRIFQPEWTTRGSGRGWGLHRVKRFLRALETLTVETDADVLTSSHPALTGAALQLVLPEHEADPPSAT